MFGQDGFHFSDPVHDAVAWREYLETVERDRAGWSDFYEACRALKITFQVNLGLDADDEAEMLDAQNECTFIWSNKEGWPVGVIMSYVYVDGKFWLTASSQRARISAVRRDPRVCIVVTSTGSKMARNKTVTYKGHTVIHDDPETKLWMYKLLAAGMAQSRDEGNEFTRGLDREQQVVLEADLVVEVDVRGRDPQLQAVTRDGR